MKKLAFLLGIVFFTTVAFSQTKPDASKQDQKKQPAKTEQVKPAEKTTAAPATEKKDATPAKATKKHKGTTKKTDAPKKDK